MSEQTAALLEQLAMSLGTTAEYLWGALLRQALISGITNLVLYTLLLGATVAYWRALPHVSRAWDDMDSGLWAIGGMIVGVLLLVCHIFALASLEMTAAAFLNPEYWALKQVLGAAR